jgi:signal transduction histidine kinase/CheY-like chemotaxis protein
MRGKAMLNNGSLRSLSIAGAGLAHESTVADEGRRPRIFFAALVALISLVWAPLYIGLGYFAIASVWEFLLRPPALKAVLKRFKSGSIQQERSLQAGLFVSAVIYALVPLQGVFSGHPVAWFLVLITFCSSVVCAVTYFVNDRLSLIATSGPLTLIAAATPIIIGLDWTGVLAVWALNVVYISAAWTASKYYQTLVVRFAIESEARAKAESSNQAKSQFLATMSHELRTPLNAIIGYSEMMKETAQEETRAADCEDHDKVIRAAHSLLTLINDLLDISKIDAGKMQLNIEMFSVAELAREAASIATPLAQRKGNCFDVDIAPNLGEAYSDSFRVNQCLLNLLSNAAKFTEKGALRLSARRESDNGEDWLVFEITDTGIGMSEVQLEQLFQPFVQADSKITRAYGGTGLGLAITRRIANMLGGEVTAESELGKGSIFTLRVPAYFESALKTFATPDAPTVNGQPVVLVIDDDEHTRDLAQRRLSKIGLSVICAGHGDEGEKLARAHSPAIILLDINLPDRSGWSVLEQLRQDRTLDDTPILIVSIEDDRQRALALGACDLLTKPVDKSIFVATVLRYARPASASSEDAEQPARAFG